jgi:hypothetical protein
LVFTFDPTFMYVLALYVLTHECEISTSHVTAMGYKTGVHHSFAEGEIAYPFVVANQLKLTILRSQVKLANGQRSLTGQFRPIICYYCTTVSK